MLRTQMRQSQPDLIRTILPTVMAHIHITIHMSEENSLPERKQYGIREKRNMQ